jgi:hypothetical protein
MHRTLLVVCLSCLVTSLAVAQTKMSSTIKCGKPSVEQMVPVGDRPDHSFGVTQGSCTSSKPWTIAGVAGKEGVGTSSVEANGAVAKSHGVYVETKLTTTTRQLPLPRMVKYKLADTRGNL